MHAASSELNSTCQPNSHAIPVTWMRIAHTVAYTVMRRVTKK